MRMCQSDDIIIFVIYRLYCLCTEDDLISNWNLCRVIIYVICNIYSALTLTWFISLMFLCLKKKFFLTVDCSAYMMNIISEYCIRKFWRGHMLRVAFARAILAVVEVRNWLSHASTVAKKYYRFPSGERRISISIRSVNLAEKCKCSWDPFASSFRPKPRRRCGRLRAPLNHLLSLIKADSGIR